MQASGEPEALVNVSADRQRPAGWLDTTAGETASVVNGSGGNISVDLRKGAGHLNLPVLLLFVVVFLTIAGNVLVILAVSLEKKLQTATNYFLMSLAVADMLVGILVMPISLLNILYGFKWPLPLSLCPVWIYLDVLFSTASIMHLCAISLDRYIAIKKPIEHSRFNSRTKALLKILAVWVISVGISMPVPVLGLQDLAYVYTDGSCQMNISDFIIYGSLSSFFLPLIIMVASYVSTTRVLRQQALLCEGMNGSVGLPGGGPYVALSSLDGVPAPPDTALLPHRAGRAKSKSVTPSQKRTMQAITNEQRASKVLGIVFLLFVGMWCPFFITNVLSALCPADACNRHAMAALLDVFVWVGYVSSGVNPLVYTLFNRTYRQAFARYIACNFKTPQNAAAASRGMNREPSHNASMLASARDSLVPSSSTPGFSSSYSFQSLIGNARSPNGRQLPAGPERGGDAAAAAITRSGSVSASAVADSRV
ncbi:5-hydroxytryptamine receptor 2A [Lethenteron reissneri]|uniref:5-hydroxytryptamine receptor 2A n=1 Tax=Lethenteron reissneri TaxID=7753 RepID=UPI002AB7073D|nr:5-hydroxytryptamine receptor 2A [Lethenteron reissneri]